MHDNRRRPERSDGSSENRAGVEIRMINVDAVMIPVVLLEPSSCFSQHVSWILQQAVGSDCKAEALYERHVDRNIQRLCAKHGWSEDEIFMGRCTVEGLRSVVGVGRNGKRSVMLSLAIAVIFYVGPQNFEDLFTDLQGLQIMTFFDEIMQRAWETTLTLRRIVMPTPRRGDSRPRRFEDQPKALDNDSHHVKLYKPYHGESFHRESYQNGYHHAYDGGSYGGDSYTGRDAYSAQARHGAHDGHGIKVDVILDGTVPIVSLEKGSAFSRSAAWLLQLATKKYERAADMYVFVKDERIIRECKALGHNLADFSIVELQVEPHVRAVGISGKRGATMALVVALLLARHVDEENMLKTVRREDPPLEEPLGWLTRVLRCRVESPCGNGNEAKRKRWGSSPSRENQWSPGGRESGGPSSSSGSYVPGEDLDDQPKGRKRRQATKDSGSGKDGVGKVSLDDQLDKYFAAP